MRRPGHNENLELLLSRWLMDMNRFAFTTESIEHGMGGQLKTAQGKILNSQCLRDRARD
jgi:hypothetical protein